MRAHICLNTSVLSKETPSRFVGVCKIKLVRVTSWALLPFYLPPNHLIVESYFVLNQILVPRLLGFKLLRVLIFSAY